MKNSACFITIKNVVLCLAAGAVIFAAGMCAALADSRRIRKNIKKAGKAADKTLTGIEKFVHKHI